MQKAISKCVTYREVMIFFGMPLRTAKQYLTSIRAALGKRRGARIHVAEFCQYEGLDRTLYENELRMEFEKMNKKFEVKQPSK